MTMSHGDPAAKPSPISRESRSIRARGLDYKQRSCGSTIAARLAGAGCGRWIVSASEQRFRAGAGARAWNRVFRLSHVTGTRSPPRRLAGCAHMPRACRCQPAAAGSEHVRTVAPSHTETQPPARQAAIHMGTMRATSAAPVADLAVLFSAKMQCNHGIACVQGRD
jgi:hypothetical protein